MHLGGPPPLLLDILVLHLRKQLEFNEYENFSIQFVCGPVLGNIPIKAEVETPEIESGINI